MDSMLPTKLTEFLKLELICGLLLVLFGAVILAFAFSTVEIDLHSHNASLSYRDLREPTLQAIAAKTLKTKKWARS